MIILNDLLFLGDIVCPKEPLRLLVLHMQHRIPTHCWAGSLRRYKVRVPLAAGLAAGCNLCATRQPENDMKGCPSLNIIVGQEAANFQLFATVYESPPRVCTGF
jgi:hypothetical protein